MKSNKKLIGEFKFYLNDDLNLEIECGIIRPENSELRNQISELIQEVGSLLLDDINEKYAEFEKKKKRK